MSVDLKKIGTEQINENTKDIDLLSTKEILTRINDEDKTVAYAVSQEIDKIGRLCDAIVNAFYQNGRLIYLGAGTSGRIGIIDAVECRPTYGVSEEMVQCLMAGGEMAFVRAIEGAEDNKNLAKQELMKINLNRNDVVVGIAASGRTPYVIGGVEYAKEIGCITGCIVTSPNSILASMVDFPVEAITKEEVITGSTRMKSGTAQKMICNMISTGTMIKMGKVYQNLMIDVLPTNEKLVSRAISILQTAANVSKEEATIALEKYKTVKKALFSFLTGIEDIDIIEKYLNDNFGHIRNAINNAKKEVK